MYDKLKRYIGAGLAGGVIAVSLMSLMGPRDGSGNFTLPSGNPVTTGTAISSTWANNTLSDIATGLTNSLAKDGQTTPTANLPMGTFRHTNVGDASARNHYATVNQVQDNEFNTATSVAGTNAITASLAPAITSYSAGMTVVLTPANNNTGATTMALNGLTALDALKYDGDALVSGDLVTGIPAFFVLDSGGDDWILLNPQSSNLSNGVAMSDLARLSQQNTFTASGTNTSPTIGLSSSTPLLIWNETGATADNRRWRIFSGSEQFQAAALNDAGTVASTWLTVDRTGTTVDSINLQATSLLHNGAGIWTAANDGTGSGLDADLLDGQHGSFYQSASNLNAGTIPDARIASSGVTQHQGSLVLAASQITSGTLAIARGGTGTTDGTARNITGKAGTTKTLIANASCPPAASGDGNITYCY